MPVNDLRIPTKSEVVSAILRKDLASFVAKSFMTVDSSQPYLANWHIEVIADHLMRAYRREIKRLVITIPPRNLKSISASVAFVAWALGQNPNLRFITASYSGDLSLKHARDTRSVMQSDWYKQLFPGTRLKRTSEDDFETDTGGGRLSTSVGGTLTGRGADFIIIDDPIKPQDIFSDTTRLKTKEWLGGTVMSRLNNKNDGVIILIMQRLHVDDPVAHVLEQGGWTHLDLPAIAETDEAFALSDGRVVGRRAGEALHPARESLEALERIRRELGSLVFSAQYLQRPVPAEGNFLKREWLKYYDFVPHPDYPDQIIQSWDIAMTDTSGSNYSVGTTWITHESEAYLIDVRRVRLQVPELKRMIANYQRDRGAGIVLIEESTASLGLIQQLEYEKQVYPISVRPVGDKQQRLASVAAMIEAGRAKFPREEPWLDEFMTEILAFPSGRNDDQVDSMTQFLIWFRPKVPIFFG